MHKNNARFKFRAFYFVFTTIVFIYTFMKMGRGDRSVDPPNKKRGDAFTGDGARHHPLLFRIKVGIINEVVVFLRRFFRGRRRVALELLFPISWWMVRGHGDLKTKGSRAKSLWILDLLTFVFLNKGFTHRIY